MVKDIPYVVGIVRLEHDAVTLQCWNINVIHRIIFQYHPVVTCFVGITEHHLQLLFGAMIVTFMIAFECAT